MSFSGWLLIIITGIIQTAANIFLRMGVDQAGGFEFFNHSIIDSIVRLFIQPYFFTGFVLYGLAAVIWFRVIASEQLSIAYPVLVSITFFLVTLSALWLFDEKMTTYKAVGLIVIIIGILIISGSEQVS